MGLQASLGKDPGPQSCDMIPLSQLNISEHMLYINCRTPVWLKTFSSVLVQEGGGSVHGWCAERGNRGKGGSGQGKIGAKVVGDGFLPIWGFSWDAVAHQVCIFWHHFWPVGTRSGSSRDPVGIQSGTNFGIFRTAFGRVGKQLKSP